MTLPIRPLDLGDISRIVRPGTFPQPLCTCVTDTDGRRDTDGCALHDLPLSGLLIGEVAE